MFIYCDHASHPSRPRSAVTNFYEVSDGRWNEYYTTSPSRTDSGTTLANNSRLPPSFSLSDADSLGEIRSSYQLVCRRCPNRPVPAREANLFRALTAVSAAGASKVSLSTLAAILSKQSDKQHGADPEAGQG
jgi:hypothetical protein